MRIIDSHSVNVERFVEFVLEHGLQATVHVACKAVKPGIVGEVVRIRNTHLTTRIPVWNEPLKTYPPFMGTKLDGPWEVT